MAPPRATIYLWVTGAACGAIGWSLFLRMAAELNRVLPPRRRIPLIEFRYHISEIKRLHEESFPASTLRVASLVLITVSALLAGAGIVVGIAG